MALGFRLFLLILFATYVAAADDAEFAFNLLSDIAPILALFGDQFAKQFTSESHTWLDHLIFAMVPLGIITAITGAIRAQGMPTAKAFIGRARESQAQVEIELMSSTSSEVCEIFNGSSIVRAMGQPKIAQFLIFPKEYESIERNFKSFDEGLTDSSQGNKSQDTSCGIHTLKSAFDDGFIDCTIYRSKSSVFFQARWEDTKRLSKSCFQFLYAAVNRNFQANRLKINGMEEGRPNVPTDSDPPPDSRRSEMPAGARDVFQNPPNIQLNISSDHFSNRTLKKGHEIFLAVTIGLLLQTGLIAIAAVTTFRISPTSSSLMESRVYGFPCYVGGSLLLSLGTGLCTFIVEHTTDEYSWDFRNVGKDNAPRLLWLQQKQSVNDQSFNGYVISSGPKRRVITSSRGEGPERKQASNKSKTILSSGRVITETQRDSAKSQTRSVGFWEWLTVAAALSAGLGFTAQFMGLRGLAFPCSIAQLGSIFIMALIRAGIRRRLGSRIKHSIAFQWYEIDFLAAQIALRPKVRAFDGRSLDIEKRPKPEDYFGWMINTRHLQDDSQHLVSLEPNREADPRVPSVADPDRQSPGIATDDGPMKGVPTSQQLLRVRKRLADLTKWKTRSSASAIALVRSIQLVMKSFFPDSEDGPCSMTWILQATFPQSSERQDSIKFSIVRNTKGIWDLDAGLIDAAMSLWMASIDAKRSNTANRAKDQYGSQAPSKSRKQGAGLGKTDWRFGKDDDTLRYRFYRIIGDNLEDDVLKRDISWWADNFSTKEKKPGQGRAEGDELIIGFNGISTDGDVIDELGVSSEASLPKVLAQHLFTSFMWTVVEHLPKDCLNPAADQAQNEVEVDGAHTFESYSFEQTWPRLRLRHRRLTELVRKIESFGMGTTHDILLCMIPALSYKRLLPNQAVLELIPRVGPGRGWAEIASCHQLLLKAINKGKKSLRDRLYIGIVTASMDFLSLACEPYGEHIELPSSLKDELSGIVDHLSSPIFADLRKKLVPVYHRQHRQSTFENIFHRLKHLPGVPDDIQRSDSFPKLDEEFAKSTLGFNDHHLQALSMEGSIGILDIIYHWQAFLSDEPSTFAEDIFGWTPYHYMAIKKNHSTLRILLRHSKTLNQRLPKLLCAYSRSPFHLAALEGISTNLEQMVQSLSDDMRRHVFQTGGIDGMTPLHLIAKRGHISCLDLVTPKGESLPLLTKKDIWGRQALHLASRSGCQKIWSKLLELGARSDHIDEIRKCPVDYFLESNRWSSAEGTIQVDGPSTKPAIPKLSYLNMEESREFFQFSMESPFCRYGHGRTFLHSAVELAHPDTIKYLVQRGLDLDAEDDDRRTPLHYAILEGREDMATTLIKGFNVEVSGGNGTEKKLIRADLWSGDSHGTTVLMFAVEKKLYRIIKALLSEQEPSTMEQGARAMEKVDGENATALFYAHDLEMIEYLVGKGFNTTAKNSIGRTRLHTAINGQEQDIALYLLRLRGLNQVQDWPWDDKGESLLITACRRGLSALVDPIRQKWESLLEQGDKDCDQSPLAWACDEGHTEVVRELLRFDIDLNRPASKWKDLTPLHFSVTGDKMEILDLLLQKEDTDIGRRDRFGETALDRAIEHGCIGAARVLLLHDQTSSAQRIEALKRLIPKPPQDAAEQTKALVSDALKSIKDEGLVYDLLVWLVNDTKSTDGTESDAQEIEATDRPLSVIDHGNKTGGISADASKTAVWGSVAVFLTPLVTEIIQKGWGSIGKGNPYDLVMLLGDNQLREAVKGQQMNNKGFDSDMWSCADYIERFDRGGVMGAFVEHLRQSKTQAIQRSNYMKPAALAGTQYMESVDFIPCSASRLDRVHSCNQVYEIEVVRASDEYSNACIRSDHCIPPSSEGFYFEVKVLEDSLSGIICIGFCGVDTGDDECPGWFPRSWAYHGDDGKLYIERGYGVVPSDGFGVSGTYGKGDTVGVGLNVKTGQGFCILNGKILNMGNGFSYPDERFLFGKIYPCVGFDLSEKGIGLHLQVNLGGLAGHPFGYEGPYNFE